MSVNTKRKKKHDLPNPFLGTSHKGCVYLGRRFAQKIQREEKEKCFPERVVRNIDAKAGRYQKQAALLSFSQL